MKQETDQKKGKQEEVQKRLQLQNNNDDCCIKDLLGSESQGSIVEIMNGAKADFTALYGTCSNLMGRRRQGQVPETTE